MSIARQHADKSLSMTASTPIVALPSFISGIPPAPDAITIYPLSILLLIISFSTILIGLGEEGD